MARDINFFPDLTPTPVQWEQLKKAVIEGHEARQFYLSMNGLLSAKSVKLAALVAASNISAFVFYSQRKWGFQGSSFTSWSLGLFTTVKAYRGEGFSRKLIENITEAAIKSKVDFLYLQGIPSFYSKFGFSGFAPKSKFIFKTSSFLKSNVRVVPINRGHHEQVKQLYEDYSRSIGNFIIRSSENWRDFFLSLSSTFLFYRPLVILDHSNRVIGYFCVSPTNPAQIREVVFRLNHNEVLFSCSALAAYVSKVGASHLEIYAPARGPIYELCLKSIEADFVCLFRPSSSNMIKQISRSTIPQPVRESFIFQGDNL